MPIKIDSQALASGIQMLTLTGNMTLGKESQHFEWFVNDLLKTQKNRIIVDMSGVGYVDSSAIGILVACHSNVTSSGGQFRLTGVVARVAAIFKMTGVDRVLKIDATPQDAVGALAATA
jgi:anti-anti-sigma factor